MRTLFFCDKIALAVFFFVLCFFNQMYFIAEPNKVSFMINFLLFPQLFCPSQQLYGIQRLTRRLHVHIRGGT